ncbi:MAG: GNAT family N-acetyltransferase [Desulfobacterales bacterium]|nr:MAG: GNAT family N-acetyltransferase [Desulfobacterales bacterium]
MADKEKYFLCTERLGFRRWRQSDLDLARGLWGDPRVTELIDARGQLSENQVKERLAQEIATAESYDVQYWPIFLLSNDSHVGCCGLRPYDMSRRIYEIGFHIRSEYWQHGFACEAARAVMEYAFKRQGAAGLFAGHNPKNVTSRYLLEKLGFRYTHDEYYAPTGLDHPSYLMTADEFSASAVKDHL